jgi:ATP-binding cassette, subfamily C (CFTR/MRP), member 1
MADPTPEQRWAASTEASRPHPHDAAHAEPLAERPLAVVVSPSSEFSSTNQEQIVDEEAAAGVEEYEDSQSDDVGKNNANDNRNEKNLARPHATRSVSARTNATGTSAATSLTEAGDEEPKKSKRTCGERLNPLKRKNVPPVPKAREVSREYNAGFFSKLYFQWMAPLMDAGYQRPLELNDIWMVNPNRSVDVLQPKLLANYKRRRAKGSSSPLVMAIYDTFQREFWIGGCCQVTASTAQVLSPFTMKYLITFAGEAYYASRGLGAAPPIGHGIGLVFGITMMQLIQSLCTNHFIYRGMTLGGQARGVLITVIFDKAMKLSGRARAGGQAPGQQMEIPEGIKPGSKEEKKWLRKKLGKDGRAKKNDGEGWGNGRIINLMSMDTYRVDQASGMFHMCWTSPIQVWIYQLFGKAQVLIFGTGPPNSSPPPDQLDLQRPRRLRLHRGHDAAPRPRHPQSHDAPQSHQQNHRSTSQLDAGNLVLGALCQVLRLGNQLSGPFAGN